MAEEKVTLPCHHQLGLPEKDTLDIEWLLTDNEGNQKVVSIQLARALPSLLSPCSSPHPPMAVFPQSSSFLLGWKELELLFQGQLGGSVVERLPSAQGVILGSWD